ncbi:Exodeoxyribonuclease 7 small subunit [Rickettsiales endosymbiont of Paramecium tredecaurelia]|uniref:exodeoxyribonuclease VII small subunit n=1 Tax=Candidatus Sarmatiella mevalonica TaxID=2770581 RepID=UPI00192367ED|nr:exodeoxyribonuclease VII small subunit [Candidatus Sarmatiella mevalonica]MBL3284603.1 Exodeoxyribonuclease 7 small subunit [Candidatus Sarmatiella mevalonica]
MSDIKENSKNAIEQELPNISAYSFEEALGELEEIVRKMSDGRIALNQAVSYFKRGAMLREYCEQKLKSAKFEIEEVLKAKDEPESI